MKVFREYDPVKIKDKLANTFNDMEIAFILNSIESSSIIVPVSNFEFKSGNNVKITMLGAKGWQVEDNEVALTSNFEAEIEGMDSSRINKIEIPPLDCSETNIMYLQVKYLPVGCELRQAVA